MNTRIMGIALVAVSLLGVSAAQAQPGRACGSHAFTILAGSTCIGPVPAQWRCRKSKSNRIRTDDGKGMRTACLTERWTHGGVTPPSTRSWR